MEKNQNNPEEKKQSGTGVEIKSKPARVRRQARRAEKTSETREKNSTITDGDRATK